MTKRTVAQVSFAICVKIIVHGVSNSAMYLAISKIVHAAATTNKPMLPTIQLNTR